MTHYLSFDIGGTYIKFAVLTEQGIIIEQNMIDTVKNGEQIIRDIVAVKHKLAANYTLQGVAFSIPGFVNTSSGFIQNGGSIKDFHGINFKQIMGEKLGLPVELDNDANCVAMAEKWLGKGKDSNNFICMTIGTGIGGAICINGEILRGHSFMGAEFGYMLINNVFKAQDRMRCSMNVSASISEGLIGSYRLRQQTQQTLSGNDIYQLAEQGDDIALQVIDEFYQSIASGLYNLTFILNPQKILIGGAISSRGELLGAINQKFQAILDGSPLHSGACVEDFVSIESAHFKNNAGLIGALYHFLQMTKSSVLSKRELVIGN